ncbi:DNA repair protein RecO [Ureaplasma zalophigenitalium]|uniref:DNA repair protein RecO n=1 Tax=Ureaplasma zalophigenitalium TaxID=907723 RepID=A0ABT3BPK3_9BACT|nr:DNA repair protein RecO [Ureaplasma zalophigenitalium]MCV3754180.1 DNA repair protein RecO [Ureaplasma zalophigenitalium]
MTRGYLVKKTDFNYFDEILTFLNEYGNLFTMYAPGVKRITSKNSRSLFFGNYLEFEFFHSTTPNKLGKLKKVVALHRIDYTYENHFALLVLNYLISSLRETNQQTFNFYQEILAWIIQDVDPYVLSLYTMIQFAKREGILFSFRNCVHCQNDKRILTFDQSHLGLICANCFKNEPHFILSHALIKYFYILNSMDAFNKKIVIPQKDAINLMKYLNHILANKLGLYIPYIDYLKNFVKK